MPISNILCSPGSWRVLSAAGAAALVGAAIIACQGPAQLVPTPAPTPANTNPTAPPATAAPSVAASPTPGPAATTALTITPSPVPPSATGVVITLSPGTVARYRVQEQFARQNLPNDAVGETPDVTGAVVLDAGGQVVADRSKVTMNARTLRSDDSDRDEYLRTDGLETDRFQQIELTVQSVAGLPWPLPAEGNVAFQLEGSMTAHGVTAPVTWEVQAQLTPNSARGQARTSFPFDRFGMKRPSAFFLLSVEDNIRLELDFVATVQPAG